MTAQQTPLLHDTTGTLSQNERFAVDVYARRLVDRPLMEYLLNRDYHKENIARGEAKALLIARIVAHVAVQSHSGAERLTVASIILHDIGTKLLAGVTPALAEPLSPISQLQGYATQIWEAGQNYLANNPNSDTQMAPNLSALAAVYRLVKTPDPMPDAEAVLASARARIEAAAKKADGLPFTPEGK